MRLISASLASTTAFAVLAATLVMLSTSRLEYCGQPATLRPSVRVASAGSPTLAPPPKTVFVQIETDEADIEVRISEWGQSAFSQ